MNTEARLLVFDKRDDLAWVFMPQVRARIAAFCQKYGNDAVPVKVLEFIDSAFASGSTDMLLLGVLRQSKVIAHVLGIMCEWFGVRYLLIMQYEIDEGARLPLSWNRSIFTRIEEWARAVGASDIRCVADNPRLARAYRTFYKMEGGDRVWMRKAV